MAGWEGLLLVDSLTIGTLGETPDKRLQVDTDRGRQMGHRVTYAPRADRHGRGESPIHLAVMASVSRARLLSLQRGDLRAPLVP